MRSLNIALLMLLIFSHIAPVQSSAIEAQALVENSFNYMRGNASISTVAMTIHRPEWERRMIIQAWTKGQKDSLIRILAPPKDKGNGTLKKGKEMWMYNPKVNRAIKLPPSMMSQAWMGSDFSNNDLAKTDSLIEDYVHSVIGNKKMDGKTVYILRSMPKSEAPVVWGMQELEIREDFILLKQSFYDEDSELVKFMSTDHIRMLGGKLFPARWIMYDPDAEDTYTALEYQALEFKDRLKDSLFTVPNLKNPRR